MLCLRWTSSPFRASLTEQCGTPAQGSCQNTGSLDERGVLSYRLDANLGISSLKDDCFVVHLPIEIEPLLLLAVAHIDAFLDDIGEHVVHQLEIIGTEGRGSTKDKMPVQQRAK